LADQYGLSLQGRPFHILNRVLDVAIGLAVQSYATHRALDVRQRREEYLAFVMHDLRTPLNAISLAAGVLEQSLASVPTPPENSQMFRALPRNIHHLEGLVDKVIQENANLRTETGIKLEGRYFDLWPLVESLIHDVHPVAGTSSTKLVNDVPEDFTVYQMPASFDAYSRT
jgi:signal transduction histidine kinase